MYGRNKGRNGGEVWDKGKREKGKGGKGRARGKRGKCWLEEKL